MPVYDAMGNVSGLMTTAAVTPQGSNYAAGDLVAAYAYDAYGRVLRASGAYAEANPFGYSTKYTHREWGLVYYGHRHYSPSMGRFIHSDPIEQQGGINLYAFVNNNPVNSWDYLGLKSANIKEEQALYPEDEVDDDSGNWMRELEKSLAGPTSGILWWDGDTGKRGGDQRGIVGVISDLVSVVANVFRGDAPNSGGDSRGVIQTAVDWLIGNNSGAAWRAAFTEKWVPGPTGGRLPQSLADGMMDVVRNGQAIAPDMAANGMHAWHAGSNAYLVEQLGVTGAPLIFAGGLFHESPLDWGSFMAEQRHQGTVNHFLDSMSDIVANAFGLGTGILLSDRISVDTAIRYGNQIPGPGEPDPAFGGTGDYNGKPSAAWGTGKP